MNNVERFIELRLPLRGLPYVALLLEACPRWGFVRAFDVFRVGAERRGDGSVVVVHRLPDANNIYEVDEPRNGTRWYFATLKGDPVLHRIRKFGAKLVAQKRISIQQAIERFPEPPVITDGEVEHA